MVDQSDITESSESTVDDASTCASETERWSSLDISRKYASALHVDDSGMYVIEGNFRRLMHISLDGKLLTSLFELPNVPPHLSYQVTTKLQSDGRYVYWGTDRSEIYRASKSGGLPELLIDHQSKKGGNRSKINAFYYDAPDILYSVGNGPLFRLSTEGGDSEVVVEDSNITWVSADSDRIYWRITIANEFEALRSLSRGEDVISEIWRSNGLHPVSEFNIHHDEYIYQMHSDLLVRIETKSGKLEYVARLQEYVDDAFEFLIDNESVYWTLSTGAVFVAPLHPTSSPPKDPLNPFVIQLAKVGSFDADDYGPKFALWENHIYWQAGTNLEDTASDEDPLFLFRRCLLE